MKIAVDQNLQGLREPPKTPPQNARRVGIFSGEPIICLECLEHASQILERAR